MKSLEGDVVDFMRLVPSLTDEEWAARDAKVASEFAASEAEERRASDADRRARYEAAGFTRRALDAAANPDANAAAIRRVRQWPTSEESVLVLSGAAGCGKTVAATWWALGQALVPRFMRATAFFASSRYDHEAREKLLKVRSSLMAITEFGRS